MLSLYLFAVIPLAFWVFFAIKHKCSKLGGAAAVLLFLNLCVASIVHVVAFNSKTKDSETWSGQVTHAVQEQDWTEKYQEAVYRTEVYTTRENGKTVTKTREVFSHWEWRTRYHPERYFLYSNIGVNRSISKDLYLQYVKEFGGEKSFPGDRKTSERRSHMISGDPNDYATVNKNNPIIPITKNVNFTNRLKLGSVWDKTKPPENAVIHPRPENKNPFVSDRLCGEAKTMFSIRKLDEINAVLGPSKQVDINIVGYNTNDSMYGQYTESVWQGGNKNSLTIVYGGENISVTKKPKWTYCFGWSDSDVCKRNIEQLFLQNELNDSIFEKLKQEIAANYQRVDWHKFDYISVEPDTSDWAWVIICALLSNLTAIYIIHQEKINSWFKKQDTSTKVEGPMFDLPVYTMPQVRTYTKRTRKFRKKL